MVTVIAIAGMSETNRLADFVVGAVDELHVLVVEGEGPTDDGMEREDVAGVLQHARKLPETGNS